MGNRIKSLLIGRPLRNEAIVGEKYGVLWGLPILSSDPISSVAYAGEQILLVLLPIFYAVAYKQLEFIIGSIVLLLVILVTSYRQTIEAYPNGGGAYIVAKDNLGSILGVTAGAALAVDYILTIAVSVASGVEQITSAFMPLRPYTTLICIGIILILMLGNLRGIRESSRIFGMPTYLFIAGMAVMIAVGAYKLLTHTAHVNPVPVATGDALKTLNGLTTSMTMILLLKAFSNGCAALTGVEAVSNAVPNFKEPGAKHAKKVLLLLAFCVFFILGGTTLLAANYHVTVGGDAAHAVIVQLAQITFGGGFMYYYVVGSTFVHTRACRQHRLFRFPAAAVAHVQGWLRPKTTEHARRPPELFQRNRNAVGRGHFSHHRVQRAR